MKIALINPPYRETYHVLGPVYPIGLGMIQANCKKSGIKVDLYDFTMTEHTNEELIKKYSLNGYDVIGVSSFTIIFESIIKFIRKIKECNSKIQIVVGGHHMSLARKRVLEDFKEIDYGLIGFGEKSFCNFLLNYNSDKKYQTEGLCYRRNNKIFENPISYEEWNLDDFPFPDRNNIVFDYNKEMARKDRVGTLSISSSRGCPYRCTYCVNCKNSYWLKRSVENVMEEIEDYCKTRKCSIITFADCNFFVDPVRAKNIVALIHAKYPNIKISFQTRTDQIVNNEAIIKEILETGPCIISVGVESDSENVLKRYQKDTTCEINQKAMDILKKYNAESNSYIIMFEALENLQDIRKNYEFLVRNKITGFMQVNNLYQTLVPFFGATYYERYHQYYKGSIHTRALPEFVHSDVRSLYDVISVFRNEYEDEITELVYTVEAIYRENKNNIKTREDLRFLMKCQYIIFEYFLIMAEKYGLCYYNIFKESAICKKIDELIEHYLNEEAIQRIEKIAAAQKNNMERI